MGDWYDNRDGTHSMLDLAPYPQLPLQQFDARRAYVYPEHRDHDADDDREGGHGDLFPANTPCVLISQGSSGSDQPFMRAVPWTLAALRVERRAVQSGLRHQGREGRAVDWPQRRRALLGAKISGDFEKASAGAGIVKF